MQQETFFKFREKTKKAMKTNMGIMGDNIEVIWNPAQSSKILYQAPDFENLSSFYKNIQSWNGI